MFYPAFFILVSCITIGLLSGPAKFAANQPQRFLSPPKMLKYYTLGYDENVSDTMWLRVIQDFDFCENNLNMNKTMLNTKTGNHAFNYEGFKCEKGWAFSMLDAITTLTPRFKRPYVDGGTVLSVLINDAEGARIIFDRGLEQFSGDWKLWYSAAYNHLFELKDKKKASEYLLQAARLGAPPWVYSLAANLFAESGELMFAKKILEEEIEKRPNEKFTARLQQRLDDINKQLEKAQQKH